MLPTNSQARRVFRFFLNFVGFLLLLAAIVVAFLAWATIEEVLSSIDPRIGEIWTYLWAVIGLAFVAGVFLAIGEDM